MRAIRRLTVRTVLPAALADLDELARNLRWTWHPPTRDLFARLDPRRWEEVGADPLALLAALPGEHLAALAEDTEVLDAVRAATADLRSYLDEPRWYQGAGTDLPAAVAYFSPEFGVTALLSQYSGGLGVLAGDHLKSASDLGVPLVGVGLLYGAGYFVQSLTHDGWQTESYPVLDPSRAPLTLLREADGEPARVSVDLVDGRTVHAQVWVAHVGRVPLLLLDSDVSENDEEGRAVTDRLYGGGGEHRLQQELLLGIGGVRALRTWSRLTGAPAPEVMHSNEGHAGFLGIERIRELVDAHGLDVDVALAVVRAGTVFTTHTPVPAGIDRFGVDTISAYLGGENEIPGVGLERILALGAEDYEGGDPSVFNMAVMGMRLGGRANAVSRLHGEVSRGMFSGLWPGLDAAEVPIVSITNGVHAPTWVDRRVSELAAERLAPTAQGWLDREAVSDAEVWQLRHALRAQTVADVRRRLRASWIERGASPAELGWVDDAFSPDVLTLGFARRVPTYKRLTLMLRDPDRLRALLLDPERPVQLVVAGKAHPADDQGKRLIQQLVDFADDPAVRHRIAFLPDYGIEMARVLYPGCDVWLNNPLRPLEACGTSGMKVALNGGLNLSILDGWWDEWFEPELGWAIPTADGVEDADRRDDLEAAALYALLETQVAPRFYDRDGAGVPGAWVHQVRHTLATLGPKVQATRMVEEYVRDLYAPAALAARELVADGFADARDLVGWSARVRSAWEHVRVEHVEAPEPDADPGLGERLTVRAFVALGTLTPQDVDVQVVHGRPGPEGELLDPRVQPLTVVETYEAGRFAFAGDVVLDRAGEIGYTVRVVAARHGKNNAPGIGLVAFP